MTFILNGTCKFDPLISLGLNRVIQGLDVYCCLAWFHDGLNTNGMYKIIETHLGPTFVHSPVDPNMTFILTQHVHI